jgi:hypothetical protein
LSYFLYFKFWWVGLNLTSRPAIFCCVLGHGYLRAFAKKVYMENQTLINHKCVCRALNRHFCQTRVIASVSSSAVFGMTFFAYSHLSFVVCIGILKFNFDLALQALLKALV